MLTVITDITKDYRSLFLNATLKDLFYNYLSQLFLSDSFTAGLGTVTLALFQATYKEPLAKQQQHSAWFLLLESLLGQ